ncbi:class I SAM-dependent methyltransferase [Erysipelothrix sp. D19-032]
MRNVIQSSSQEVRILNLFGYTGAATIACAMEPNVTEVVHIDALKSLNEWTRENISLNRLDHKMIRTITEDVIKFLNREKRRGRTYHGIIMDPPSFGRGPKGERWKIKDQLAPLLQSLLNF